MGLRVFPLGDVSRFDELEPEIPGELAAESDASRLVEESACRHVKRTRETRRVRQEVRGEQSASAISAKKNY